MHLLRELVPVSALGVIVGALGLGAGGSPLVLVAVAGWSLRCAGRDRWLVEHLSRSHQLQRQALRVGLAQTVAAAGLWLGGGDAGVVLSAMSIALAALACIEFRAGAPESTALIAGAVWALPAVLAAGPTFRHGGFPAETLLLVLLSLGSSIVLAAWLTFRARTT